MLGGKIKPNPKIAITFLILLLVICNFVFTTSGWERFFWGFFGYVAISLLFLVSGLNFADIGLSSKNFKSGMKYGGLVILVIAIGLISFYLINKQGFRDPRYHQNLGVALMATFIWLPLRTIFFEELVFRGLLLALIFKLKPIRWFASLLSSFIFGLWHVNSSRLIGTYNIGNGIVLPKAIIILAVLIFTTSAGVFLCELRWRSKSLVAPIIVHWFVNGFAMILAALSW